MHVLMASPLPLLLSLDVAVSALARVTFLEALTAMATYPTLLKPSRLYCMTAKTLSNHPWDSSSFLMCKRVDPFLFTGAKLSLSNTHHDYGWAKAERV